MVLSSYNPIISFTSGDFTRDKLAFIQENRLGKVLPGQARSGFATYTPVAFDLSRLSRYDREGVEEFCRQWGLDIPKEQEKVQGRSTGKKKRERWYWKKPQAANGAAPKMHSHPVISCPTYFPRPK